MAFVDMHIHSIYSDGTYTPEEIVRHAIADGAGLIAVCDHNAIQGALEVQPFAETAGLTCIPGVEIDAIWQGLDVHVLCYGADFENRFLRDIIDDARFCLDEMSTQLLLRMQKDYPRLDYDEYMAMPHDTKFGGWKMLKYLWIKGISKDMRDGFRFYETYDVTYAAAGFKPVETVIQAIHAAGGRAVLAHPGVTLPYKDMDDFKKQLNALLDTGFDGVECHYPRNSRALTRACRDICRNRNMMITAGSDCHGAFGSHIICETRTERDQVYLRGLMGLE